jgi:hypothetical protein
MHLEVLTQTQFKVIFCSYSLPTGAPSTRPRSTQYVRRWRHHDSAVAAVKSMLSFSRLYRPADQSVVQTSFSSLTLVLKLQLSLCFQFVQLYLCAMCVGFDLLKVNYFSVCVYFGEPSNVYTLLDVFLPTSHVFKVSIFQFLRHSPFFTWFVLRFTSFS